eukprot:Gregarina_sp_Poly_1__6277@NODE_332_length_9468_cov_135_874162_g280_i0_p5_GENE_NODE_332_length_9468_cov_135_874162_g280_i0NODE_332_length_9468_cov_135_874162_g280_i0_p5_ORF_typecomplete_len210_score32_13Phage_TAC_12/PF12363_8/0_24_NODE_332_length_9468_cov_135_874162_g280_i033884017
MGNKNSISGQLVKMDDLPELLMEVVRAEPNLWPGSPDQCVEIDATSLVEFLAMATKSLKIKPQNEKVQEVCESFDSSVKSEELDDVCATEYHAETSPENSRLTKPRRLVALEGALEPSSAICKENGGDSGKTVTPNDRSGLMQSIFGVLTTGSSRKRVAAPAQNEPPTSEHKRRRRIKLRKYELDAIDMEQFFLQPSLQVRITRKSKQF